VIAARSVHDISEATRITAERGDGPLHVLATGHAGVPVSSGVLMTTRRLDTVRIDPDARIATIGAGARWAAVVAAAAPYGLAPVAGGSTSVGVVGYLVGGGLGPLARSHGYSSDYLVAATLVTPDAEVLTVSAEQHPDLFWAVRGGRDGFGVIAEVQIRLVELPELYAGSLTFSGEHIETIMRGWADWSAHADPRATTSVVVINFPDLDDVPDHLRGRRMLRLRFAFPGAASEGEAIVKPLRDLAPALVDAVGSLPLDQVARIHDDPEDAGPSWFRGFMLTRIDQDFVTTFLHAFGSGGDSPFMVVEVRHLGGATARDVIGGSAVGGRPAAFSLSLGSPFPPMFTSLPAAALDAAHRLEHWLAPETTINLIGNPISAGRYEKSWPQDILDRLDGIRASLAIDPPTRPVTRT
jgi:hypothetical protein